MAHHGLVVDEEHRQLVSHVHLPVGAPL